MAIYMGYSHQGVLSSTGAFICTGGYITVLGSGLVPNLEEGCFFSKFTGTHLDLYPFLDSVSMTAPSPLVGFTRLQLMCSSVEGMVFTGLKGAYGTSNSSTILVMT